MSANFPKTAEFSGGLYRPSRVECEIRDLEVEGIIPEAIRGTFYQVSPDPQYPPMLNDDIFFNGDGNVSAFKFASGSVSLIRRYVQTDRLLAQRKVKRSLNGIYRNVYTNDPLAAKNNTTANTTVLAYNGALLALKEDALPYSMDLDTLETLGVCDFDGQIKSETFTAHPKIDPVTGNLVAFAYEAKGDGSLDIAFYELDRAGKLLHEIWFEAPYAAMIHDCGVTENHIILPFAPLIVDVDRLKAGGRHFEWQADLEQLFAIIPRRGNKDSIRWFKGPKDIFLGHVLNAFERDGFIHLDMTTVTGNVFYFFPEESGFVPLPETLKSTIDRWTFNLSSTDEYVESTTLFDYTCEFPRCDDRYVGQEYEHGFLLAFDPTLPYNENLGPYPFQFFNQLVHFQIDDSTDMDAWYPGDSQSFQEPIFVPRSLDAPEGDGYVIALMNNLDDESTDLVILDSLAMSDGPIAKIKIPVRMRMSLHGSWHHQA